MMDILHRCSPGLVAGHDLHARCIKSPPLGQGNDVSISRSRVGPCEKGKTQKVGRICISELCTCKKELMCAPPSSLHHSVPRSLFSTYVRHRKPPQGLRRRLGHRDTEQHPKEGAAGESAERPRERGKGEKGERKGKGGAVKRDREKQRMCGRGCVGVGVWVCGCVGVWVRVWVCV